MPLNNDDIKQLINILQRGLTTEETAPVPTKKRGRPKTETKTAKSPKAPQKKKAVKKTKPSTKSAKSTRSSQKSSSNNLFDSMPEKNFERNPKDKALYKYSPSPRTRKSNMIDVKCRSCGDKNKVSADLVLDKARYKCNKCAMTPG